MAAEIEGSKLNRDAHLALEQSMLRVPHELSKRSFKSVQRNVEREKDHILPQLNETVTASASGNATPEQTVASLDEMIARMKAYAKKLETLHADELRNHEQSDRRLGHLAELNDMQTLSDVRYDQWSYTRLNRYVVEYLFRNGLLRSAEHVAGVKGIADLTDIALHQNCARIADSLRRGETRDALRWCAENRAALRKQGCIDLEFHVRYQEYVEIVRRRDYLGARHHALTYMAYARQTQRDKIREGACLLVFEPDTMEEPFAYIYAPERWNDLAELFVKTHHELFGLSSVPIFPLALTAGLSALKTPHCVNSQAGTPFNDPSAEPRPSASTNTVCPVCSPEMNQLARNVPYAHQTNSLVDADPVILPNGRVYGEHRLSEFSKRNVFHVAAGKLQDPVTGEIFGAEEKKKVFIL